MSSCRYEVDIVRKDPATGRMVSVPCYEQYNHHYSGFMYRCAASSSGRPGPALSTTFFFCLFLP